MSRLADLQARMRSLRDIADILSAMKNLALVEITKLSRFCATQQEMFQAMQSALRDFQQFYGAAFAVEAPPEDIIFVLIGSERGFCGGFNDVIQKTLNREAVEERRARLILVGRRLALRFLHDRRVIATLEGPSATEDIPAVISRLAAELARYPALGWKIVYNSYDSEGAQPRITSFTEASEQIGQERAPAFAYPPLLNLPPAEARPQLVEQYLLALFHGVFYLSFLAENHERLRHMDGALNKLQDEEQRMRNLSNALRQESITEELELILLNVKDIPGRMETEEPQTGNPP